VALKNKKQGVGSMTQYRWFVVGFGFIAIIITYLDRTALSYAITPLELTFGLSNADFGVIAAAFGIGYMVMTVGGGVLVDRYGSRKMWSLSAVLWSSACALLGLASGFWWLFAFRLILGLAEGPSFPAFSRVTADWLPVSERARAIAIGLAAVPFASVIGAPLSSHLVAWLGWRLMFFILGALGILWAVAWVIIFRDRPQQSKHVCSQELNHIQIELDPIELNRPVVQPQKTTWRFMLFNKALLVNNYAFFSFGYLLFFAITWLPGYLEQSYHVKVKAVGWFLVLPWLLASVLLVAGGFLSDWLWHKKRSIRIARSHIIWVCQLISALCFIPVVFTHSLTVALLGISFGVGIGMMPNAAFYAINADLARDRVATSLGIMDCAFALAGILAPLITGFLSTLTGNFTAAFSLLIVLSLTSALAIILFQHPDEVKNTAVLDCVMN
jgi:ACS family hexuronate transporter-like MFS transporter